MTAKYGPMTRLNVLLVLALVLGTLGFTDAASLFTNEELRAHDHKAAAMLGSPSEVLADVTEPLGSAACIEGMAAELFACDGVDLLRFIPVDSLDNSIYGDANGFRGEGSDVWGWTSSATGDQYVLMGKTNSTAFFRIIEDEGGLPDLSYLGELPNRGSAFSVWKDIKVYADHAYIVAEAADHGMQVFDLSQLDDAEDGTYTEFTETAHYLQDSNNSHNMVINPDTGSAFIVGSVGTQDDVVTDALCDRGGLHRVDISDPANPTFGGCYTDDLYVHDAQCVVYHGPVTAYQGRELCFNASEQWLSVVDVTDAANPVRIGIFPYARSSYVHQGWLTEDHRFFLLGDETDEQRFGFGTRTMIFDFSESLSLPQVPVEHFGPTAAIDHNMYTRDGLLYQSNYAAGLRILDTEGLYEGTPTLEEIAFFDVFPDHDRAAFVGTWSVYPYFDDGVVAVNAYDGLFLLQVSDAVRAEGFDPADRFGGAATESQGALGGLLTP